MITYLPKLLLLIAVAFVTLLPSSVAYAACPGPNDNSSKGQVLKGVGQAGGNCSGGGVMSIVNTVVEILSLIVGIAAIIMIIIAGLKYVTSSGDAGKISSAKTTLIYALVGLAIAALAQVLVKFILEQTD